MATYLKTVLRYVDTKNGEPAPYSYQYQNKVDPKKYDPNKLMDCKKVEWGETVASHAISW